MKTSSLALMLIVPVAMAACAKKPPPPPPTPMLSPAEQACLAQGAATAAVDASTVTVVPVSSTKVGDTIFDVVANGITYTCVASPEGAVSHFAAK